MRFRQAQRCRSTRSSNHWSGGYARSSRIRSRTEPATASQRLPIGLDRLLRHTHTGIPAGDATPGPQTGDDRGRGTRRRDRYQPHHARCALAVRRHQRLGIRCGLARHHRVRTRNYAPGIRTGGYPTADRRTRTRGGARPPTRRARPPHGTATPGMCRRDHHRGQDFSSSAPSSDSVSW